MYIFPLQPNKHNFQILLHKSSTCDFYAMTFEAGAGSHLNSSSLYSLAASVLTEVGPTAASAEKKNGRSYVYWYTLLIEEYFMAFSLDFFITVKK